MSCISRTWTCVGSSVPQAPVCIRLRPPINPAAPSPAIPPPLSGQRYPEPRPRAHPRPAVPGLAMGPAAAVGQPGLLIFQRRHSCCHRPRPPKSFGFGFWGDLACTCIVFINTPHEEKRPDDTDMDDTDNPGHGDVPCQPHFGCWQAGRCCHRPMHAPACIRQQRGTSALRRAKGPGGSQPGGCRYRPGSRQHLSAPGQAGRFLGLLRPHCQHPQLAGAGRAAAMPLPAMTCTSRANKQ